MQVQNDQEVELMAHHRDQNEHSVPNLGQQSAHGVKYVFSQEEPPTDVFGKHLKDFEATGKSCLTPPKLWLGGLCSYDSIEVTVKYSFYTEGVLERKRSKVDECWTCCVNDNNTWKFYPRHLIDHIQIDNLNTSRCCGFTCCACVECASHNTLIDIVTRTEISTGVSDATAGVFGCVGGLTGCCSGQTSTVALKIDMEEAEKLYLYCQNYTYNTNYQPSRIYNMEFLKTVGENKYAITPSDWVNYFLSTSAQGFRAAGSPVPFGGVNLNHASSAVIGGAASGGNSGMMATCCPCCK